MKMLLSYKHLKSNFCLLDMITYRFFFRLPEWRAFSWVRRRRYWRGFWMLQPQEIWPRCPRCCPMPPPSSTKRVTTAGRRSCSPPATDTTTWWRHCFRMGTKSQEENHIVEKKCSKNTPLSRFKTHFCLLCFLKAVTSCRWTIHHRLHTISPSSGATDTSPTCWAGQMMTAIESCQALISDCRRTTSAGRCWTVWAGRGLTRHG